MIDMRVLVACECSGVVREAFRALGHDAWSCDFWPSEIPGPHFLEDAILVGRRRGPWDLVIAHPPCTDLAVSGRRWFFRKRLEQALALDFVKEVFELPVDKLAVENPISVISTRIRPPDQIVHPWWFGHGETKATCWWLRGLPLLVPSDLVPGRVQRVHRMAPGPARARERSRTLPGVARALAFQWGGPVP